jgi:hypothetical protein
VKEEEKTVTSRGKHLDWSLVKSGVDVGDGSLDRRENMTM